MSILKYPTHQEGEARLELYYSNADIWTAVQNGRYERVKELLDNDAYVDARCRYQTTALMIASTRGSTDIVQLLLDRGADINATNFFGDTPLILASCCGHTDIVKLLLDRGADVNIENTGGHTASVWALRWATVYNRPGIMELLRQHGAE